MARSEATSKTTVPLTVTRSYSVELWPRNAQSADNTFWFEVQATSKQEAINKAISQYPGHAWGIVRELDEELVETCPSSCATNHPGQEHDFVYPPSPRAFNVRKAHEGSKIRDVDAMPMLHGEPSDAPEDDGSFEPCIGEVSHQACRRGDQLMGMTPRFNQSDEVIWFDPAGKRDVRGIVQFSNLLGSPADIHELTTVFFPELNRKDKVPAVQLRHLLPDHSEPNKYMHEQAAELDQADYEFVQAPKHYNGHPSGVECQIIIRECKDPMIAFAMKHLWRSQWGGKPGQSTDQDLSKAVECIQLEQARRAGKARL